MTPAGVLLRPATPDDAAPGADLQIACWRETYAAHTDPAVLEARLADRQRWVEAWERQLALGPPRVVAESAGALVGFAVAGPSRDDDAPVASELYALYARAAWWGRGVGPALLEAVLPAGTPASLWVLETNGRARAFYGRHGFLPDGHRHHYDGLDVEEVRLVRR